MNKQWIIIGALGLIWGASALLIMAPNLGLANPVYPRPQPDYELCAMMVSGALLAIASLKSGIDYIRP